MKKAIHPESLLRIPLVSQMYFDQQVKKFARAVDKEWSYQSVIKQPLGGFSPFAGAVFYPQLSAFANWLKDPFASARPLNDGDHLVHEVYFAAHDYLHAWAYFAIHEICPDLGFAVSPITSRNIEDFAFCHILSEAVATVGLDYWYLATVNINDVCPIGTQRSLLSIKYHERLLREFRRFNPEFSPQKKEFFNEVAAFYCSGVLQGFDEQALTLSAQVGGWLEHELAYGEKQREYIRLWLAYLSKESIRFEQAQLSAPLRIDKKWKRDLVFELGERLWDKVKNDRLEKLDRVFDPADAWRSDMSKPLDFRFMNLNARVVGKKLQSMNLEHFDSYFWQRIGQCEFDRFPKEFLRLFPELILKKDAALLERLLRDVPRCQVRANEPVDLFFIG